MAGRLKMGARIRPRILRTIHGQEIPLPDPSRLTHLQFRRFAGCPVCSLHLRRFARRADELERAGVHEIILFHSSREALLEYAADLPLDVVADPEKRLYAAFVLASRWRPGDRCPAARGGPQSRCPRSNHIISQLELREPGRS